MLRVLESLSHPGLPELSACSRVGVVLDEGTSVPLEFPVAEWCSDQRGRRPQPDAVAMAFRSTKVAMSARQYRANNCGIAPRAREPPRLSSPGGLVRVLGFPLCSA